MSTTERERKRSVNMRDRPIDLRIAIPVFWNQDIDAPLAPHKGRIERPVLDRTVMIPRIRNVADKRSNDFSRPDDLITYKPLEEIDYVHIKDYDVDSEDEAYLKQMSKKSFKRKDGTVFKVDIDKFEEILNHLEKYSFIERENEQLFLPDNIEISETKQELFNSRGILVDADDIPCCVCAERDSEEGNVILFCDGCDIAVHQVCHGVKEVPSADWYCHRCVHLKKKSLLPPKSLLLTSPVVPRLSRPRPLRKSQTFSPDPRQRTLDSMFRRVAKKAGQSPLGSSAADAISLSSSRDIAPPPPKVSKSDILLLKRYNSEFEKLKCALCTQSGGALVKTNETPHRWVHYLCALCLPELSFSSDKEFVDLSLLNPQRESLVCCLCSKSNGCIQCGKGQCRLAYHPTCAQLASFYMYIDPTLEGELQESYCEDHTIIKENQELEQKLRGQAEVQLGRFLDKTTRKRIGEALDCRIPKVAFQEIVRYWKKKRYRLNNGKSPLIRRLLIETAEEKEKQRLLEPGAQQTALVQHQLTREEKYLALRQLRSDLERSRTIADLIRHREKRKYEISRVKQRLFDQTVSDYNDLLLHLKLPKNFVKKNVRVFMVKPSRKKKKESSSSEEDDEEAEEDEEESEESGDFFLHYSEDTKVTTYVPYNPRFKPPKKSVTPVLSVDVPSPPPRRRTIQTVARPTYAPRPSGRPRKLTRKIDQPPRNREKRPKKNKKKAVVASPPPVHSFLSSTSTVFPPTPSPSSSSDAKPAVSKSENSRKASPVSSSPPASPPSSVAEVSPSSASDSSVSSSPPRPRRGLGKGVEFTEKTTRSANGKPRTTSPAAKPKKAPLPKPAPRSHKKGMGLGRRTTGRAPTPKKSSTTATTPRRRKAAVSTSRVTPRVTRAQAHTLPAPVTKRARGLRDSSARSLRSKVRRTSNAQSSLDTFLRR